VTERAGEAGEWVDLVAGAEVPVGQVVGVDLGGEGSERTELVVWRDLSGRPCVMDARCPHQWSYLGFEGVVDGDELVCASHFWRFDGQGRGTKVNVNGRRDVKADVAVYPAAEVDGRIRARVPVGRPGPAPGRPDPV
jgi:phenylpropionate dioxygenase-like ring-hydroxylating dioxygenase large terminal subunit